MELITKKNISLKDSISLANYALGIAKEKGFNICATVVDTSGVMIASLRDDNANQIVPDSSFKKAFTAIATKNPTLGMANAIKENLSLLQFSEIHDNTIVYGGGRPIKLNDEIIGALGIAGCPGGHLDDEIAQASISKFFEYKS